MNDGPLRLGVRLAPESFAACGPIDVRISLSAKGRLRRLVFRIFKPLWRRRNVIATEAGGIVTRGLRILASRIG